MWHLSSTAAGTPSVRAAEPWPMGTSARPPPLVPGDTEQRSREDAPRDWAGLQRGDGWAVARPRPWGRRRLSPLRPSTDLKCRDPRLTRSALSKFPDPAEAAGTSRHRCV